MVDSRSRTLYSLYADLGSVSWLLWIVLAAFVIKVWWKVSFWELCLFHFIFSSSGGKKILKSFWIWGSLCQAFYFLYLSMLGVLFHFPIWSFTADCHFKLLDKNTRACIFFILVLLLICSSDYPLALYACYSSFSVLCIPVLWTSPLVYLFSPRRVTIGP